MSRVQILRRSCKKSLAVASPRAVVHMFILDKSLCRGSPSSSWPGAGSDVIAEINEFRVVVGGSVWKRVSRLTAGLP